MLSEGRGVSVGRRLLLVFGVQAALLVLAIAAALAVLAAVGQLGTLFPRTFHFPLTAGRPDASPPERVREALEQAFPAALVQLEGDGVTVSTATSEPGLREQVDVLSDHGYRIASFTIGRQPRIEGLLDAEANPLVVSAALVSVPLCLLIGGLVLRSRHNFAEWEAGREANRLLWGFGGGLVLAAGSIALERLGSGLGLPVSEQPWIEAIASGGFAPGMILLLVAVVAAPLGEEIFYRGWMMPYLSDLGRPIAYAVPTLLFALVHFNAPAVAIYIFLGFGLAFLYERTRSVWTPIIAHATHNLVAVLVLLTS